MRIKVTEHLGDLERDLAAIPARASRDVRDAVRHGAMTGNLIAKDAARASAGRHGKHYPRSFTWDKPRQSLFASAGQVASWSAEYGPDPGRRQGRMSFEEGSRNQPAHNDLEKSRAAAIGLVAQDIRKAMDSWFWGGAR